MAKRVLYMFCGHIANFLIVSLPEMLHSYILLILQGINFYNTCIVHGRNSKSHSPQCLQCLVDFEGFSQSNTSFISNYISIKTVFKQHKNKWKFYPLKWNVYI